MTASTTIPYPPASSAFRRLLRDAAGVVALGLVYAGLAKVSLAAAAAHHVVSSIWPPAGLAVFALVRFGLRFWPGVAIGAYLLNVSSGISPEGAAAIALGNTLEALVGAYLFTRVAKGHRALDRVRDVLALAGFAGILSTAIAASIGVASLVLSGGAERSGVLSLWVAWWSGDAVGVLVVAPLLLWWAEPDPEPASAVHIVESAVTFALLAGAIDLLFREWGTYVYPLYPLVTWIALRLGRRGAATAVAIVMVLATSYTISGMGPFTTTPTALGNLFELQLFLALLSVPSFLFAAAREEARHAAVLLGESEGLYRTLARNLPDGCVALFNHDLRFELVEGPAVAAAGFVKEEVEGRALSEVFGPEHAIALGVPFQMALHGQSHEFEFSYNERAYLLRVLPLTDAAGSVTHGMALALDITQRQAALHEIAESRARLEVLSRRLLAAQEDERRRVSREVHDELGQALTGIKLGLGSLRGGRGHRRDTPETDRRIQDVSSVLDGAIDAVHRITLRLRPGVLDNLGPLAALEWEVQQFTKKSGIPVRLTLPPDPLHLDGEHSTTVYRTVQEALTNVLRHADARAVSIDLEVDDDVLVLQVMDDGRGISDNELRKPRSMGILGMRERAVACGGTLEVRRAESGGTRLVLTVPQRTDRAASNGH